MGSSDDRLDPEICKSHDKTGQAMQWSPGLECHAEISVLAPGIE